MGKKDKKKKKKDIPKQSRKYDQEKLNEMADCLEEYIHLFDIFIIKDGVDEEKYKKAMKRVKKAIKDLRAGNGDAVFDQDRYDELIRHEEFGEDYV